MQCLNLSRKLPNLSSRKYHFIYIYIPAQNRYHLINIVINYQTISTLKRTNSFFFKTILPKKCIVSANRGIDAWENFSDSFPREALCSFLRQNSSPIIENYAQSKDSITKIQNSNNIQYDKSTGTVSKRKLLTVSSFVCWIRQISRLSTKIGVSLNFCQTEALLCQHPFFWRNCIFRKAFRKWSKSVYLTKWSWNWISVFERVWNFRKYRTAHMGFRVLPILKYLIDSFVNSWFSGYF